MSEPTIQGSAPRLPGPANAHTGKLGGSGMRPMSNDGSTVAAVAPGADALTPLLMEFESPSAALIAKPVPPASRYVTWIIASMFAVAMVIMSTMKIDRVVSSTGKVVAIANNIVVQPLETSIVRSINVKEGQVVRKGALLARLDPTFTAADAGALETSVASLQAEVDRLHAEGDGRPYSGSGTAPSQLQALIFLQRRSEYTFKLEGYTQKIESQSVKVAQAEGDVSSFTERAKGAKEVLDRRRELERLGVGSTLNRLQAEDTYQDIAGRLASAKATVAGSKRDLATVIAERDAYIQNVKTESSQQLNEQGRKLADAKENLTKARLRNQLVEMVADRDAVILSVAPVNVGSVMASGDQFITMVPVDSPLEIEAVLDGRDSGYVGVGDSVTIKFETFPYTLYGIATGTVRSVSPDSFRNPNNDTMQHGGRPQNQDNAPGQYFFRARISMDEVKLHDLPPSFRMTPGMPVTADVKVGQRTLMAYIFARVIPIATEGMREP